MDDPSLGGVNRTLDELMQRLDHRFVQSRVQVTPNAYMAPVLDADIIVIHFTVSWRKLVWLTSLRKRNSKASLILVEHSYTRAFEARHVANRGRFRTMLRMVYGLMDRVVAVSQAQGDWLAEAAGLPPGKLVAINPHTDLLALRKLPLPRRGRGPLLLCAYGRYAPQKGFDTLIEAMGLVSPKTATLRLIGLGPDAAALRAQAAGFAHVSVEGPVASPDALLSEVDAVVIPSRFEAFGNVGLEARAAARPIIVTGVDGLASQAVCIPELIVPPENPQALARAIEWLASQDLARLGDIARRSVAGAEAHTIDHWNSLLDEQSSSTPPSALTLHNHFVEIHEAMT